MSHLLFFNLVLLYLAFKSKHSALHICFLGQAASNTSCFFSNKSSVNTVHPLSYTILCLNYKCIINILEWKSLNIKNRDFQTSCQFFWR